MHKEHISFLHWHEQGAKRSEELHKRAEEEQRWHDRLEQRTQEQAELRAEKLRQREQQNPRWDDGVKGMHEAMQEEEECVELGQFITA